MIHIFSTQVKSGKGGISTALIGYVNGFDELNVSYCQHATHSDLRRLKPFIISFIKSFSVKKHDICWFHHGPWFSMLRKLVLMFICKTKGGIVVSHLHSPKVYDYLQHSVLSNLIKIIFLISDKVVVVAPWWKELLVDRFPEYRNKIIVSLNPIDTSLVKVNDDEVKRKRKEIKIISMCRLEKGKGVDNTIKALAELPDTYSLDILGVGSQEKELQELVKELNLSNRVRFIGWVDYDEKMSHLDSADVFCLPSRLDSFGMVYIEAMARNLPIVALRYQAIPDVVPEFASVLVEDDSPFVLAQAVTKASCINFSEGRLPSEYVNDTFNYMTISKKLLDNLYDK
ncbi:glycosyltransferase family 4 protein [Photobacterium sp. 1_MG-2023]|uniref:glycosyltransferase family 4 protein n=1 Tax=Photobacterium sp. 1_MG-2023 TaxID=3062646 RepID=UPI0026E40E2C|nr:glycosyltransferase family 4 protein [Photobacterium sp. 1_MG-2023]